MEGLPTTKKAERRWRSKNLQTSKPSLVMAFFSCVAWLYVAGRLWQDAENRTLLANLLNKNIEQRPKVLTVEDKLMVLGCKDLERRIVEAEMDFSLAKSQGYLKHQLLQSESSSEQKLLAVIGVYTGFGSHLKRKTFRGSWMPRGDALKKLEERGVVIQFVIGRSANRGDSLDRNIDEENRKTKDFFILEGHEEAQEELPKKVKFFFSTAVQNWDAEFYVKVDDNIDIDLEGLVGLLERRRGHDSAYIGCMKSGQVVAEEGRPWYEPDWWKFGDEKSYFRHASGSFLILSKNLARYININSASLKTYAHDDISVGSWMMGVQSTYIDDNRLCCSSIRQGFCLCSLNDIIIGTVRTGKEIQGKPEWKVTITNNCKCTQHELKLACKGFQSVETVDPNILQKQGDNCLIIKGNALKGFTSVSFAYAWDPPFLLSPSGSVIEAC